MNKILKPVLVLAVLCLSALITNATAVWNNVEAWDGGYNSASGSFANIPGGAHVIAEASAVAPGSAAYASADGGGLYVSIYCTDYQGGDDEGYTNGGTINYNIWVSGYGYAFVDVEWGYGY